MWYVCHENDSISLHLFSNFLLIFISPPLSSQMCNYLYDTSAIYRGKRADIVAERESEIDRQSIKTRLERIANRKGIAPDLIDSSEIRISEAEQCERMSMIYQQQSGDVTRKLRWAEREHARERQEYRDQMMMMALRSKRTLTQARKNALARGTMDDDRISELNAFLTMPFIDRLTLADAKKAEKLQEMMDFREGGFKDAARVQWEKNAAQLEVSAGYSGRRMRHSSR